MEEQKKDTSMNIKLPVSSIETIDTAFFKFIDETLNIHCTTADGFKKVPVIWANSERSYQIKNNVSLRDQNGSLIPPIISISRKSISKDPTKKGTYQANLPPENNRITYTEELNQDKTSNFANADTLRKKSVGQLNFITSKKNNKKVYRFKSVLMPVYVMIEYEVHILTSYMQQINEITQPFMTKTGAINSFIIKNESFRYECFIQQEFSQDTEITAEDEKKHKSVINIKVLGQLVGEGVNQDISTEKIKENPVEIKFPRENLTFFGEEQEKNKRKIQTGSYVENIGSNIIVKKVFLIGGGTNPVYTVVHNFNSRDIMIFIRETTAPYALITAAVDYEDKDYIKIDMGDPVPEKSYSVTVLG